MQFDFNAISSINYRQSQWNRLISTRIHFFLNLFVCDFFDHNCWYILNIHSITFLTKCNAILTMIHGFRPLKIMSYINWLMSILKNKTSDDFIGGDRRIVTNTIFFSLHVTVKMEVTRMTQWFKQCWNGV